MSKPNRNNDDTQLLAMFAGLILFALLPPVAVVIFFVLFFQMVQCLDLLGA